VSVEPHVVTYLVSRIERSLLSAIQIVDKLDRAALEQKTRITRALAAQVLADTDGQSGGQTGDKAG
jgi:chromosomal replication initiation ATPase DnaA